MKIYCGICCREGSCTAIYPRSLQPTTVNTTTSARKDNQVAIPTVTIPTPFFFQSVRGDVSFVSENNARIVFDTLPSPLQTNKQTPFLLRHRLDHTHLQPAEHKTTQSYICRDLCPCTHLPLTFHSLHHTQNTS